MARSGTFAGFSPKTVDFFSQLAFDNSREWFEDHRADYEQAVMAPARAFIVAMGDALRVLRPDINAIPLVNKSIFRLNRDTRFAKDKSPYKTHLGLWFWEGEAPRMECPGFYFHLEPPMLMLGSGMYTFPKPHLDAYREMAIHKKWGPKLTEVAKKTQKAGLELGVKHYKRVPLGIGKDHPNAELLMHNGLTAMHSQPIPDELYGPELVPFCLDYFEKMLPMHLWLLEMCNRIKP